MNIKLGRVGKPISVKMPSTEREAIILKQGKGVTGAQHQFATPNTKKFTMAEDARTNKIGW